MRPLHDVIKLPINRWRKHRWRGDSPPTTYREMHSRCIRWLADPLVEEQSGVSIGHDVRKFAELLAMITREIRRKFPRKFILAVNETTLALDRLRSPSERRQLRVDLWLRFDGHAPIHSLANLANNFGSFSVSLLNSDRLYIGFSLEKYRPLDFVSSLNHFIILI